jgi:hypothetical protein
MSYKTELIFELQKDIRDLKKIANEILLENQDLKRTIVYKKREIAIYKQICECLIKNYDLLLKTKQDEIYTLQSRLIQKEMEK